LAFERKEKGGYTDTVLLDDADSLMLEPRRVLICGTSGSGKTTLARQIGQALKVPATEIDALYHGPNWIPSGTFLSDIEALMATESWVIEWQYAAVRSLLLDRADLIVWLDLPHLVTLKQVTTRTLRRRIFREQLWNGNFEPPLWTMITNPEHVIRWSWSTRHLSAELVNTALERRPALPIVRLPSHILAKRWVQTQLVSSAL
jgi:adenylate kinase family enzyme